MKNNIIAIVPLFVFAWATGTIALGKVPITEGTKLEQLEEAIKWINWPVCWHIENPLPDDELREVQKKLGATDEEVRQALLATFEHSFPKVDEWDDGAVVGGVIGHLRVYGKPEDKQIVWQTFVHNPNTFMLPCIEVYLKLSHYDVDDLPRKREEHPDLFGWRGGFIMMQQMAMNYDHLDPATQASMVQFFQKSVAVEDRTDVASLIDEFLREHMEGYMESNERREMVRRFGHMKGWRGGTEMGEGQGSGVRN